MQHIHALTSAMQQDVSSTVLVCCVGLSFLAIVVTLGNVTVVPPCDTVRVLCTQVMQSVMVHEPLLATWCLSHVPDCFESRSTAYNEWP